MLNCAKSYCKIFDETYNQLNEASYMLYDYARYVLDFLMRCLAVVGGLLGFGSIFIILLFGARIQRRIIRWLPDLFCLILFPSTRIKLFAVQLDGNLIRYIENPTFEMELLAVQSVPSSIQWIKNPSVELQLLSVNRGHWCLNQIKDPPLEVQLAAVRVSAFSIYYIKNQHPEAQRLAQENEYVRNHSIIDNGMMRERSRVGQYSRYLDGECDD